MVRQKNSGPPSLVMRMLQSKAGHVSEIRSGGGVLLLHAYHEQVQQRLSWLSREKFSIYHGERDGYVTMTLVQTTKMQRNKPKLLYLKDLMSYGQIG